VTLTLVALALSTVALLVAVVCATVLQTRREDREQTWREDVAALVVRPGERLIIRVPPNAEGVDMALVADALAGLGLEDRSLVLASTVDLAVFQ
jgi:hypothetical protein